MTIYSGWTLLLSCAMGQCYGACTDEAFSFRTGDGIVADTAIT